jgi:hypothetical protein
LEEEQLTRDDYLTRAFGLLLMKSSFFHASFMQGKADCHTIVIGSGLAAVVRFDEKGHNGNIGKYIEMGNGNVL